MAIIVAGGKGVRLDPTTPKQYLPLAGKPVLIHTLERFYESGLFAHAAVVLPASDLTFWPELCAHYGLDRTFFESVSGGETRFDSVGAGLEALNRYLGATRSTAGCADAPNEDNLWVAVHDGVRPLVNTAFLHACLEAAFLHGNAVPALAPVESFRYIGPDGIQAIAATPTDRFDNRPIDRTRLRSLQTPQCARLPQLLSAWRHAAERAGAEKAERFTDEATVLEYTGEHIHLCEGSPFNLKITRPIDLKWAEFVLTSGLL
ncbi:MAG: 2-C-methyl-D-erythritol 4-phosphate cytidylyltransferase [Bacteroidales bacterium]|nr:2-C-methyl-D-erythritol 4-phosphate cytidylyltransferase [Bacteroidales bacterium]